MINYQNWIEENVPSEILEVLGKCTYYCRKMQKNFPELKIKRGIVFSKSNPENFTNNLYKQYPHMWLEDCYGNIIDPTILQFSALKNIEYKSAPEDGSVMSKCMNCGTFFYDLGNNCSEKCQLETELYYQYKTPLNL